MRHRFAAFVLLYRATATRQRRGSKRQRATVIFGAVYIACLRNLSTPPFKARILLRYYINILLDSLKCSSKNTLFRAFFYERITRRYDAGCQCHSCDNCLLLSFSPGLLSHFPSITLSLSLSMTLYSKNALITIIDMST